MIGHESSSRPVAPRGAAGASLPRAPCFAGLHRGITVFSILCARTAAANVDAPVLSRCVAILPAQHRTVDDERGARQRPTRKSASQPSRDLTAAHTLPEYSSSACARSRCSVKTPYIHTGFLACVSVEFCFLWTTSAISVISSAESEPTRGDAMDAQRQHYAQ